MLMAPPLIPIIIIDDSDTLISAPGMSLTIFLISSLISLALLSLSFKSLNNTFITPKPLPTPRSITPPLPAEVNIVVTSGISCTASLTSFKTLSTSLVSEPAGRLTLTFIMPSSVAGKNSAPTDATIAILTANNAILISIVINLWFKPNLSIFL